MLHIKDMYTCVINAKDTIVNKILLLKIYLDEDHRGLVFFTHFNIFVFLACLFLF